MTRRMHELVSTIVRLPIEFNREIHKRREMLGFQLHAWLVEFERDVSAEHRRLKQSAFNFLAEASRGTILTAPLS